LTASGMTSGPIPSPGITAMRFGLGTRKGYKQLKELSFWMNDYGF
jgi:hypothetical protein